MNLLTCLECKDVIRLTTTLRSCECGKTTGRMLDEREFEVSGPCVAIGFRGMWQAVRIQGIENKHQHEECECRGQEFEAFTIPEWSVLLHRKQ